jgi:hypothetical protein
MNLHLTYESYLIVDAFSEFGIFLVEERIKEGLLYQTFELNTLLADEMSLTLRNLPAN